MLKGDAPCVLLARFLAGCRVWLSLLAVFKSVDADILVHREARRWLGGSRLGDHRRQSPGRRPRGRVRHRFPPLCLLLELPETLLQRGATSALVPAGADATVPCGAGATAPGTKKKSPVKAEWFHGTCLPFVAATTSLRTTIIVAGRLCPLAPMCLTSAAVNGELRPWPSSATFPGCVEYAMKVPRPVDAAARPRPIDGRRRSVPSADPSSRSCPPRCPAP